MIKLSRHPLSSLILFVDMYVLTFSVFGDSITGSNFGLNQGTVNALMKIFQGFLITTTYKGIIVVASQNIQQYLGYNEVSET